MKYKQPKEEKEENSEKDILDVQADGVEEPDTLPTEQIQIAVQREWRDVGHKGQFSSKNGPANDSAEDWLLRAQDADVDTAIGYYK